MDPNNPASRLLAIIEAGRIEKKDKPAAEAWASILDVPPQDKSLLLTRVGHVMGLPGAIRSEIERIDDIDHQLHLKWLPKVESSFSILNFQIQWKQFIERFDGEIVYGMQICGHALSKNRPERTANTEQLAELLAQIMTLLSEIKDEALPPDVEAFVYEHLMLIKNAIEEYRILGIRPLEVEIDRLTGAIVRGPFLFLRSRESEFGKRFWKVMGKLALVISVAVGVIQIGHETFRTFNHQGADPAPQIEHTNTTIRIEFEGKPGKTETSALPALPPAGKGS